MSTKPTENNSQPSDVRLWAIALFVTLTVIYLFVFFQTNSKRMVALTMVLLPDELVLSWFAGDFSNAAFLDRVPILLGAATILAVAGLLGRMLIALVKADAALSKIERAVFSLGVGLNAVSLYTLIVGLLGGLQLAICYMVPSLAIVLYSAHRWRTRRTSTDEPTEEPTPASPFERWPRYLCCPFVVIILLVGMLPPWHFDTREYHSQVPKEWFQDGRIGFMPHNVYGNMPLGAELHALPAMALTPGKRPWWWGALVGKTVIACYAPLTALALFAFGRQFLSDLAGGIAAFVFISTPWTTFISTTGLNDVAVGFYLFAALYTFWLWRSVEGTPSGLLLLSGFLAGAAVACKYPPVLFVVLPLTGAAAWLPATSSDRAKSVGVFLIAVAVGCGPWFAKNLVLTGNPTYPLLYEVFGGRTRTAEKAEQWTKAHRAPRDGQGRRFAWYQIKDSATRLLWRSDFHSPLLVPLAALGLLVGGRRLTLPIAALIGFVLLSWFVLTHRVDRFLIPILPLVAVLCAVGATWLNSLAWRRSVLALLIAVAAFNFLFVASGARIGIASGDAGMGDNRMFVSLDRLRRDPPVDRRNAAFDLERVHRAHKWLNANLPEGSRAMLVGEAQVFDLEVPIVYNTCFDDCVFEAMMKGKLRGERLVALREARISHIFIFWRELDRYREPGNYGYSDYVTRDLIRDEFVEEQRLLREVRYDPGMNPENSQLFEVVGWEETSP